MDTSAWYEIHLLNRTRTKKIGVLNQPFPAAIGDSVKVHGGPGFSYRVLDREFDYARGLYVTLTLDVF
jgi:hypothetical protein